eukprot:1238248-Rhodomonas_salina.1
MEKRNDDIMDSSDESKSTCVRVVPRRKAGRRRRRNEKNEALVLSQDLLFKFANVPLPKAAR